MNIFVFDPNPWQSAMWLDDVRKNKMILESAQMLSTAIRYNTPEGTTLPVYKATHPSHPCNVWARQSQGNFRWLLDWMKALGEQKTGPHKSMSLVPYFEDYYEQGYFPSKEQIAFVNCARNKERGVDFYHVSDVSRAYRLYMRERWKENNVTLSWNWGEEPEWRYS